MKNFKQSIAGINISYDENGILKKAILWPKINVSEKDIIDQLGSCKEKTIEEVKSTAELMLGAFFNKISEIELRDMETTELKAEVIASDKYANGVLRNVELQFVYKSK